VLPTQQQAVPPIVHFRQLHPLVTGRNSGADQATKMGHTYTAEVNVAGFPALFPMAASPMAGTSGTNGCPAGVSAFGSGGSIDPHDPKPAEIALTGSPVAGSIDQGLGRGVFGRAKV
jgi:hypothetical protein